MNFYIFRHGETDWNRQRRIQGSSNIPLNSLGHQQASTLAEKFKDYGVEVVLSSDLDRAFSTGLQVAKAKGVEIIKDKRLREAYFGEAEGMTIDEIMSKYGHDTWENFKKASSSLEDQSFPGGETRKASVERMRAVIEECVSEGRYQNIALSTHGGVVRSLLHSYLPEDAPEIIIPNCVLYLLTYENKCFKVKGPL